MAKYQGHSSRAAWNVALWIANDYGLYTLAIDAIRRTNTREASVREPGASFVVGILFGLFDSAERAVEILMSELPEKTPDGYRYTKTTVRAALVGLE